MKFPTLPDPYARDGHRFESPQLHQEVLAFPGVKLGGGMLSTFTELNRKRPEATLFDFITDATCSTVQQRGGFQPSAAGDALPFELRLDFGRMSRRRRSQHVRRARMSRDG
jgi:hypothetical protein